MARRDALRLLLLAIVVRLVTAALIRRPGYMDTAYYAAGAVRLAQGGGLAESFLWHYLDDPTGIPHPGFLYWMPLPSLLAAPFAALALAAFPSGSFFLLQVPFALLSALLPPLSYALAWAVARRRLTAWLAGLLTLFSGFFFPYWTLPETFAPFALFGSLALLLAGQESGGDGPKLTPTLRWLLVGLLAGLAHLTRADGVLMLPVVLLAPLAGSSSQDLRRASCCPRGRLLSVGRHLLLVAVGYLLVMGPWFIRNLSVIGAPLSSAGAKTLWLRTYDDLYCYGCDLSLRSYLAWGWGNILRSKLWAAGVNLERFLAEDCLVFLLPFVLAGLYRQKRRLSFVLSTIYLVVIYLAHSLAFTFPGPRGGFFHASSAVLPFLFAAGADGLEAAVEWAGRRRRWKRQQAQVVFAAAAIAMAVVLSGYVSAGKLAGWRNADEAYLAVDRWLDARGVPNSTKVMVGNAPGFWYYSHRPAVAVPNGDASMLMDAGAAYDAGYVVLDANRPQALADLTASGGTAGLQLVTTFDQGRVQLYQWTGGP